MLDQPTPHIAIATCDNLPSWEIDDRPFLDLLASCARVSMCSWNDASVRWSQFDCVLVRTTWDYSEHVEAFRGWVKRVSSMTRLLNAAGWIDWNCDKRYLLELAEQGVHIAPTQWLSLPKAGSLVEAISSAPLVNRWFLKPTIGASSSNTLRFDLNELDKAQAFLDNLLPAHDFMLQPYLESVETFGEVSLLYIGGQCTHSVRKVPVDGDYRVQDDYGAHDEPYTPSAALQRVGQSILAAAARVQPRLPPLLYARLDFLKDLNGRFALNELELIEPSLFFRHGPDAPGALVDALLAAMK